MCFLPVYYGKMNVYNDMVKAFQMDFDFVRIRIYHDSFRFSVSASWPDTLRINFQFVMFFSISLILLSVQ